MRDRYKLEDSTYVKPFEAHRTGCSHHNGACRTACSQCIGSDRKGDRKCSGPRKGKDLQHQADDHEEEHVENGHQRFQQQKVGQGQGERQDRICQHEPRQVRHRIVQKDGILQEYDNAGQR